MDYLVEWQCMQDDLKLEVVKGKPMEFEKDEDLPGCVYYSHACRE